MSKKILAVLDTYPALSETFLYTLLENLQGAGMEATIRARRRGKSPHRLGLRVRYLPSEERHVAVKSVLLGWYALRLMVFSPRGFMNAMRYLQKQSGGTRVRFAIAYRVFPLLCVKADLVYFSFGGLAVKYVDYFSLDPNSFFSLRGSDINIEPLLDANYASALTLALQKARGVHCVSRDIQAKAVRMSGEEAGKFQVIHTSVNPVFLQEGNSQFDSTPSNHPSLRAFVAKQSPPAMGGLLRREESPPRNDGDEERPPRNDGEEERPPRNDEDSDPSLRAFAAKQSPPAMGGLLRREERPPRNDGDSDPSLRAFAAKQSLGSRRLLRREERPPRNDGEEDHPPRNDGEEERPPRNDGEEERPPRNDVSIVSSGRLDWKKGYEHGMMAVRELVDRGVDCSWTIVGEGPHRLALEWAARDMNLTERVTFPGGKSQVEIARIYCDAQIYFHPSVHEGISNSVLEAMSMGLPVVVSDVGGMREALEDGKHGFLVAPRDWRAMADALEKLARDESLRRAMGASARAHVTSEFTREKQSAGFVSLFGLIA